MQSVRRYQIADYLKVGEEFVLMGVGFNSIDEEPNPNVETKIYVSQNSSSSTITHYDPTFAFDADHIADEAAVTALYRVGRDRLTGPDAEFELVRVDLFEGEQTGSYPARKFKVCAEITAIDTGEGGEVVTLAGNLKQIGEQVNGTFAVSSKTFTAT